MSVTSNISRLVKASVFIPVVLGVTAGEAAVQDANVLLRINAGGSAFTDNSGNRWSADFGFNTGAVSSSGANKEISNTTNDKLFATQRFDRLDDKELEYSFKVPNGEYMIRLHLADTYAGIYDKGVRLFNVYAEGKLGLESVDIFAETGGLDRALTKEIKNISVTDGMLNLKFGHVAQNPMIAGIEIIRIPVAGQDNALVRMNTGGAAYTDRDGLKWSADAGYNTGVASQSAKGRAILNTTNDELYGVQRFDKWGDKELEYAFNIPNGQYSVRMHFAETYSGAFGPGIRQFHALAEGKRILSDFDIYVEAGGENRAVVKTFNGVQVQDGKLNLKFVHSKQNPMIAGIEIFPISTPEPVIPPEPKVIARTNAGGGKYKDSKGNVWDADSGFNTGIVSTGAQGRAISGSDDDALFTAQRFDKAGGAEMKYSYSVPNGEYQVRLLLSETYVGIYGSGQRVFNVKAEGKTALSGVDIYKETGGRDRALIKTASGIIVKDGKLDLEFEHVKQNPMVGAIEVVLLSEGATVPSTDPGNGDTDTGNGDTDTDPGNGDTDPGNGDTDPVVTPENIKFTKQPSNQYVTEGASISLQVSVSGASSLKYQWYRNGSAISGATRASLTIQSTAPADSGEYYCVVSSASSSVTSSKAKVNVAAAAVEYTALITWKAPAKREDGKAMTSSDIANYEVYHAASSSAAMNLVGTSTSTSPRFELDELSKGTHYFTLKTVDKSGVSSKSSKKISITFK